MLARKKRRLFAESLEGRLPCDTLNELDFKEYFDTAFFDGSGKEYMMRFVNDDFETAERGLMDLVINRGGTEALFQTKQVVDHVGEQIDSSLEKLFLELEKAKKAKAIHSHMKQSVRKMVVAHSSEDLDPSQYTEAIMKMKMKGIQFWNTTAPVVIKQTTRFHSLEDIFKVEDRGALITLLSSMNVGGYHVHPGFEDFMVSLAEDGVFWRDNFPTKKVLHHLRFNLETAQWLVAMYLMVQGPRENIPKGCRLET